MISKNNSGSFRAPLSRFLADESGAEVVEAVLVVGLIAVICLIAMKGAGATIAQRWNTLLDMFSPTDSNA